VNRRSLITLFGATVALSSLSPVIGTSAQSGGMRRIGVLMGAAASVLGHIYLSAFLRRLDELGWIKGRNASFDVRWWIGDGKQMQSSIAELLAFSPDVIMVFSNLALAVLKPMAGTVPVVFVGVGDPVGSGFVPSLARPGGTMTGFAGNEGVCLPDPQRCSMGGKWLEVLQETAPHVTRVLTILHPETAVHQAFWQSIKEAAPRLGIDVTPAEVEDAAGIERTVTAFASRPDGGIIALPHALTWANNDLINALALRHRLPAIYGTTASVTTGGLVSYGQDFEHSFRLTAEYVDRILRGEKAGDLPVQQPAKFKLAVNLKTADAIGLRIPRALLALADEVVQ
jgi:putative ABC transport system substrate-binding protein